MAEKTNIQFIFICG